MRKFIGIRAAGAALVMSLVSACTSGFGPKSVAPNGYQYNEAIAQTTDEQLLLNLVRLRYRDTLVFMDIGSVTSQQSLTGEVAAGIGFPFDRLADGSGSIGSLGEYSTSPTIAYQPQKGAEFARRLLSPIGTDTLTLMANSGWSIERLLTCCVERLGNVTNAPSASGPTPDALPDNQRFRTMAGLLRKLQQQGRLVVEHREVDEEGTFELRLMIDAEPGPDCDGLRELLGVSACSGHYRLSSVRRTGNETYLFAQSRTVLGALYALSHGVDVPPSHLQKGFATDSVAVSAGTPDWDTFLGGHFRVNASADKPESAFVKINYRDHWFWIDDSDLDTKTTFSLLNFLISLQSASAAGATPLLTLSAGR